MKEDTAEKLVGLLVREIELLSEDYPNAREIIKTHDWRADHIPDLDKIGPATERFFSAFGKVLGDKVDSGEMISKDTIVNIPVTIDDMNAVRGALKWLGGIDQ